MTRRMQKVPYLSDHLSRCVRMAGLAMLLLSLSGCATWQNVREKAWTLISRPEPKIERHDFSLSKEEDVIGRPATVRLQKGDTLPDVARHFGLGVGEISAANPGVDTWVPEAGERILLPLSFVLPDAPRRGIVINLAAMRLFQFRGEGRSLAVSTYPVGIGTEERSTPTGQMHVERKAVKPTWHVPASILKDHQKKGDPLPATVPPGPHNPLGEHALYLNKTGYVIHGTNKPSSIGLKASNGCIRLYPEDVKRVYADTPLKTPVLIVNQPYLLGRRDGTLYLEVHVPPEDLDADELKRTYARLKSIEKKAGRKMDWKKVQETLSEARGIPVPVFEIGPSRGKEAAPPVEVQHPGQLYGRPRIPELKADAWYVLAAVERDEAHAERLAAMINHQGPQIPARVVAKDDRYRVIAGPFNSRADAGEAVRRLKVDLEIQGILIEPARKK